jgi:hypothetical protein
MTKEDLKQLIQEVYEEEVAEAKKKGAAKEEPKKEAPKAVKAIKKVVAPVKKAEEPTNKVTKNLVHHIEKQEKSNKFKGDKTDADLFDKVGKMLKRHVGRTLEEADVEKMMEEMECEECYEEGAKPDFLDLDKDGNKKEPMKKAAMDAKTSKKLKEIIEKAKNI